METTKPWWKSKTIWIGILTSAAGIIPLIVELSGKQNPDAGAIAAVILGIIQVVRRVWLDPVQSLPVKIR